VSWLCVVLIGVLCYEVVARFVFNSPTEWAYEVSQEMGLTIIVMGSGYALLRKAHVRVDVFYKLLPPRGQALVDVLLGVIIFFPVLVILIWVSVNRALFSWSMHEVVQTTFWYPPSWPQRTVMAIGLFLLALQGVAAFIRDLYFLLRNKRYD